MALCSVVAASEDPLHAPGAGHVRAVLQSAPLPESASTLMHAIIPGYTHMLPQVEGRSHAGFLTTADGGMNSPLQVLH